MATITFSVSYVGSNLVVSWAAMAGGDVGAAFNHPGPYGVASVQYVGTWGSSTLTFQGSNDGTNYVTLADPQGNALSKTADGLEAILEGAVYYRPNFGAGTGTGLTVTLAFTGRSPV